MNRLTAALRLSLLVALGLGALAAAPSAAHASPGFPGVMLDHLSLPQAPPCWVCHAGNVTSYDTVFTPFGRSLRLNGLIAEDSTSLTRALDELDRNNIDSDHDGMSDIDELMRGYDPNTPPFEGPAPEWKVGCDAAGGAGGAPLTGGLALTAVVGLALVGWRARSRKR